MKNLITILLSMFYVQCYSQTIDLSKQESIIDSLIFNEINQYRINNNLPKITKSNVASCLTNAHTNYMISCNCVTHLEIINNDTICPKQRLEILKTHNVENVEILGFVEKDVKDGVLINQHEMLYKADISLMKSIAILLVEEWKSSDLHNKNMLDKNIKQGAVTIKVNLEKEIIALDFIAFE